MATDNVQAARERTIGSPGALEVDFQETTGTHVRVEEARRVATSAFEDELRRVEARVEALEGRSPPSGGQERGELTGVGERLAHLERQMEPLDASTKQALQSVIHRVDALLSHLETLWSHVAPPHSTSTSASISTSGAASALLNLLSASSPAPQPRSPSARSAASPPRTYEELGEKLMEAAIWREEADVRRLLDEGADVNYSDSRRLTPLMFACIHSRVNIVALLIEIGADLKARNNKGDSALHLVSSSDKSGRCTSLLILAGALLNSRNKLGQTPLHLAASAGNEVAAHALFAAGASKTIEDFNYETPSKYAETDSLRRLLRIDE